ncbi:unnamed protein product [Moneuplotes crassus]|uniref:Uncharacterized protein n=1 Tax=Euplotes crassus TaxID=5936 RepID=A0AAD2D2G5_EUPCR|nr:unnamed protein product [Moneuplotes crassus]
MEAEDQTVQEKNDQIIQQEKYILVKNNEEKYQRCCSIYYNALSDKIGARLPDLGYDGHCVDHWLEINFSYPEYMEFTRKMRFLEFSNVTEVELHIGKMRNKHILNFIDFSFPNKTNELYIYLSLKIKLDRAIYFNSLVRISSKVIERVEFNNFFLSLRQLKRLVAAYRHVKEFSANYCVLFIPTIPDFSNALKNCQIQEIDLCNSGGYCYSNWEKHSEEFINLIQGFGTSSDLRLSLRKVDIGGCGIKHKEAQKIFAYNQLEGVEIIGGS